MMQQRPMEDVELEDIEESLNEALLENRLSKEFTKRLITQGMEKKAAMQKAAQKSKELLKAHGYETLLSHPASGRNIRSRAFDRSIKSKVWPAYSKANKTGSYVDMANAQSKEAAIKNAFMKRANAGSGTWNKGVKTPGSFE